MNHEGLGDTLEWAFRKMGVQAVIYWMASTFNFNCGCEERRVFLNQLFNYSKMKNFKRFFQNVFSKSPTVTSIVLAAAWFFMIIGIGTMTNNVEVSGVIACIGVLGFWWFIVGLSK